MYYFVPNTGPNVVGALEGLKDVVDGWKLLIGLKLRNGAVLTVNYWFTISPASDNMGVKSTTCSQSVLTFSNYEVKWHFKTCSFHVVIQWNIADIAEIVIAIIFVPVIQAVLHGQTLLA